ncbi:MAG: NAD(P)-dependent oxidoreductase [Burkholderiales bacterium]
MAALRVAFLGLGNMGTPMAQRIHKAGFPLLVYNRSPAKTVPFRDLGATICPTPKLAAQTADLVLTMLSDARAVEQVLFGPDGVADTGRRDLLLADMSTVAPAQAQALAQRARSFGWQMLDAPVSGGVKTAHDAKLVVLAGGDHDAFERCLPVFQALSQKAYYLGGHGTGAAMKLALQVNLTLLLQGLAEFLAFAKRAGLDSQLAVEILNSTTSNRSGLSEARGPLLARDEFPQTFAIRLMVKDLGLVAETAAALGVPLPALAVVRELYVGAAAKGLGDHDFTSIARIVHELAGPGTA